MAVEADLAHGAEGDDAGLQCKECVIATNADILAGEHPGAALAYDDVARLGRLSGVELDPQIFRIGVGEIFSCAACLF